MTFNRIDNRPIPSNEERKAIHQEILAAKETYNRTIEKGIQAGLNITARADPRGFIAVESITVDIANLKNNDRII